MISLHPRTDVNEEIGKDHRQFCVTPVNDQDKSQIDENMTPNDNGSSSTSITTKNSDRTLPTFRKDGFSSTGRASPVNGPGLAKPISMTSSYTEQRPAPSSISSSPGKKSLDVALEKNLETIATEVRRKTTKPFQLTRNDLQLFDSASSREMTPDSINTDSTNEDHYHQSVIPPSTVNLANAPWPPAVYPFPHQPLGFYLPYPTPTNGIPPFYPSLIEQQYGPQGLSAYYTQQQAATVRLLQEHGSLPGTTSQEIDKHSLSTLNEQRMMFSPFYQNQIASFPSNEDIDNLSSMLTASTREHHEKSPSISTDSMKSADLVTNGNRTKKKSVQNNIQSFSSPSSHHNYQTINKSLSRLSLDLSSDGDGAEINDADSIISFDSQKSNIAISMPILEDGLSDSENISGGEQSPSVSRKTNARNQSTHSDFVLDSNRSSLIPSHKHQFAKAELESRSDSFYIHPTSNSSTNSNQHKTSTVPKDYDTNEETEKLLDIEHRINSKNQAVRNAAVSKSREVITRIIVDPENPSVLIEGVLFRCRYLGSTQLFVDGNPTKGSRMMQAHEAVGRIKAPYGESQPSVVVDLFISTEKIMVLNTDLEDIVMDHSLRSISYIADIGDLLVLMAKRRYIQHENSENGSDEWNETTARRVVSINQKMICHVFQSEEAQSIAHSIGQAFQVAYVEYLKVNGIDDPSFTCDIDYQEVLDQQEIASEELDRFAKKECQKEAIVIKGKNEPLGIVIVESGWGSMLPTVVIANLMPGGPAARGGHLNIGDQIITVNGISLVGLPLSSCQTQIKNVKHLTTVRLLVVPCPPVVEVFIRRPDSKYQLGFSVQNGIICSLLRGGIAERGGVRVGHRIIEINGQSVVATAHERIVSMLSNSIGELRMKTMPNQMYRLLTGQETPIYI